MGSRIAMALLLALLVPACAGSPSIPRSRLTGWHAAQAGGTQLFGDLTADEIQKLAGDLARFDAIFARLTGRPARAHTAPLRVYLFRNREIAERFGLGGRWGGWAIPSLDESFVTVRILSGIDEDRSTLLHEYTHILLARDRRAPLPPWYHEGLATYFSTLYERNGTLVVGAAPGTYAAWVAGRGGLPLDRLFAASPVDVHRAEIPDFYATSWALSHYLLSTPSRRRELSGFVQQLERGVPSDEAFRAAFGRSVDRLGKELSLHVAHLASGVAIETLIDTRDLPASDPPTVVALDPGRVAYELGSLALVVVEEDEAKEFGKGPSLARSLLTLALAEDPSDARAEAALGEARAVSGDDEGALAAVRAAIERAPDDPRVRLHAGYVALLRAEAETDASSGASPAFAEAEEQYRYALSLDPDSAQAWFGLGRTLVGMGRSEDAFAAIESARRFGWSEPLDIALARILLERGERKRAADLLRPIAQDPYGGPSQEAAALLLKQALP